MVGQRVTPDTYGEMEGQGVQGEGVIQGGYGVKKGKGPLLPRRERRPRTTRGDGPGETVEGRKTNRVRSSSKSRVRK